MAYNALGTHLKVVIAESVIASSAATLSVMLFEVPVWAMFVGWISFFSRGLNLKQGIVNLVCVLIGIMMGIGAAFAIGALTPQLGRYAISAVVFLVTIVALSLAKAPVFNNMLGFFLGLVAFFAHHQAPTIATFSLLALAATLGTAAGFCAHAVQKALQQKTAL